MNITSPFDSSPDKYNFKEYISGSVRAIVKIYELEHSIAKIAFITIYPGWTVEQGIKIILELDQREPNVDLIVYKISREVQFNFNFITEMLRLLKKYSEAKDFYERVGEIILITPSLALNLANVIKRLTNLLINLTRVPENISDEELEKVVKGVLKRKFMKKEYNRRTNLES